ncbi:MULTISPECIES: PG0541 family transporter-associated protein [Bacteroidales]|uniref:Nitrogen regulatory protein P-II family n=1 Tax=Porphyromonas loveana TaxID=1884669 RepID=A0A2U1F870_9PORP|nr:PG0541 family transporter-associated protein [Porphyromonas loveana]PVZ08393.1 hypothetical protein C7382_11346 [Porphyromonas loveana]
MELKMIFITYNQAYHEIILRLLSRFNLRGNTYWETVRGTGSNTGEPHLGNHAWPTLNGALMVACPAEKVEAVLSSLRTIDEATPNQGLRAFVWNIEQTI